MTLNQRVRGSSVGTPMEESPRMYISKALNVMIQGFCFYTTFALVNCLLFLKIFNTERFLLNLCESGVLLKELLSIGIHE